MKRWYLLYCKRGDQCRAKLHLENQNIECFYPQIDVKKTVRGKQKVVQEPLFPSYMFVRFDYENGPSFTTIRSTRGVVDFIQFGSVPYEVQGDLLYELKQLEKKEKLSCAELNLSPNCGDMVKVTNGQFAGMEALYQEKDGEMRSIILVKMISQVVPVVVENQNLAFAC